MFQRKLLDIHIAVDLKMLTYLVIAAAVFHMTVGQEFQGYDCNEPRDAKFFPHADCSLHKGHLVSEDHFILQENTRRNMSATRCEVFATTRVSYFGHYSATKFTDESEYHVPKVVGHEACQRAADTGVLEWEGAEHKIALNRITIVKYFTHGSIKYSTTNIACQGEPLRRKDWQVTANMLREVHLQILVQKVPIMAVNGAITAMDGHSLGALKDEHGRDKTTIIVWQHDPDRCELGIVGRITLSTNDGKTFFNHEHLVQLTVGTMKSYPNCKISVIMSDLEGIFLVKAVLGLKLSEFDQRSVDLNSQYQTQLNYLASGVAQAISNQYRSENGVNCIDILEEDLHKTTKLKDNSFIRNLGDISLKFHCTPTVVRALKLRRVLQTCPSSRWRWESLVP